MQHEVLPRTEDFGGPGLPPGPAQPVKPGHDLPFKNYVLGAAYDEMFAHDHSLRPHYASLGHRLVTLKPDELVRRQQACELSFLQQGITFTVYSDAQATERIIPTYLLPRIVTHSEWLHIEAGLTHLILALEICLRAPYLPARVLYSRTPWHSPVARA